MKRASCLRPDCSGKDPPLLIKSMTRLCRGGDKKAILETLLLDKEEYSRYALACREGGGRNEQAQISKLYKLLDSFISIPCCFNSLNKLACRGVPLNS